MQEALTKGVSASKSTCTCACACELVRMQCARDAERDRVMAVVVYP